MGTRTNNKLIPSEEGEEETDHSLELSAGQRNESFGKAQGYQIGAEGLRRSTRVKNTVENIEFVYASKRAGKSSPAKLAPKSSHRRKAGTSDEPDKYRMTNTNKGKKPGVTNLKKTGLPKLLTSQAGSQGPGRSAVASEDDTKAREKRIVKGKDDSRRTPAPRTYGSASRGEEMSQGDSEDDDRNSSDDSEEEGVEDDETDLEEESEERDSEENSDDVEDSEDSDGPDDSDDESDDDHRDGEGGDPPDEDPSDDGDPSDDDEDDDDGGDDEDGDQIPVAFRERKDRIKRVIKSLEEMLEVVRKYCRSTNKKKTLPTADYQKGLKRIGGYIVGSKVTLDRFERNLVNGKVNGENGNGAGMWSRWYASYLEKCDTMGDLLRNLVNCLVLEEAATRSSATESYTGALLQLAGTSFEQLYLSLTAEKNRPKAWVKDNEAWLNRLPRWMNATNAIATNASAFIKTDTSGGSRNGFATQSNTKEYGFLAKDLTKVIQEALKEGGRLKTSCAGFAITAQTHIDDNDKRIRGFIMKSEYDEKRIHIARNVLLMLPPDECDEDIRNIKLHLNEFGNKRPLNGRLEPSKFTDWIKWVKGQASLLTLTRSITEVVDAVYSIPALGYNEFQAKENLKRTMITVEANYRRFDAHPLSKNHSVMDSVILTMQPAMQDGRDLQVLLNHSKMAKEMLSSIATQWNAPDGTVAQWNVAFDRAMIEKASRAITITSSNGKTSEFDHFYEAIIQSDEYNDNGEYAALKMHYAAKLISDVIGDAMWTTVSPFLKALDRPRAKVRNQSTVNHLTDRLPRACSIGEEKAVLAFVANTEPEVEWNVESDTQLANLIAEIRAETEDGDEWIERVTSEWSSLHGIGTSERACFGCGKEGHELKTCPVFKSKLQSLSRLADHLIAEMVKNLPQHSNTTEDQKTQIASALLTALKNSNSNFQALKTIGGRKPWGLQKRSERLFQRR